MATSAKGLHLALLSYRGNMFCGGQGVYLTNLARALVKRGHRVTIMAGPPYPDPVEGAESIHLSGDNFINRPARALPAGDPLKIFNPLRLAEYGLARAGSNPEMMAFSLRAFQKIRRIHRRDPFDVVHDNQGVGYGLLLVQALGIPVIATLHHPLQVDRAEDIMQMEGLYAKARRAVYYPLIMQKLVARRLGRIVTVSAFSAEMAARTYRLKRDALAVAPNGIDPQIYRPLPGVKREPGRLLFVGSSEDRKKGVKYLLEALAALPPRFRLIIVDGRRYAGRVYASDLAESLGLNGRVAFKDKIGNDELIEEYNRAFAMVVPSLFEGFGLPALEAMACGTPLISTAAGGLSEVVDKSCAILIRERSAEEIERAVLELENAPGLAARMSDAGIERARKSFSWDRAAESIEREYVSAIEANKNGG